MLLILGTGSLLFGHYYFKQIKKGQQELEDLDKTKSYQLDFVNNLDDIPKGKLIALRSTVDEQSSIEKNGKKLVCLNAGYFHHFSFQLSEEDDKPPLSNLFSHFNMTEKQNFVIKNTAGLKIFVDIPGSNIAVHNVYCFDLLNSSNQSIPALTMSQRADKLLRNKFVLKESALEVDESYNLIGVLQKLDKPLQINSNEILYTFKPRYISGNQKEYLMKYMDEVLAKKLSYSKRFLVTAIILGSLNFVHQRMHEQSKDFAKYKFVLLQYRLFIIYYF